MKNSFFGSFQMRFLTALGIFMGIVAMGSYATLNFERVDFLNPAPAVITVEGEGEVMSVPDIGQFTFTVRAENADAAAAQKESGTKVNDILTYLSEQGIEEKDVKTQNYNLYPRWRYEESVCAFNSYCPPGKRVEDGFQVSQSVVVKVRDTDKAGEIIAGVGSRGATNISGLNFTIDDIDALQDEARALAIKNAQEEAARLAEQLGVKIVRLVSFNESGGKYYQPMAEARIMTMDLDGVEESFGGAELPKGEQTTTARVSITYQVK